MTKAELAAALAAFEQQGGTVTEVKEGVSAGADLDGRDSSIMYCACGCYGDYTEHSMRLGENGRRRMQGRGRE